MLHMLYDSENDKLLFTLGSNRKYLLHISRKIFHSWKFGMLIAEIFEVKV